MAEDGKPVVLFLCTGNSCRSQMAEGWARRLARDRMEARSAGTDPRGVNPRAVRVMREAGVDISGQRSKHAKEFAGRPVDLVVTLCGGAKAACPFFPGAKAMIHRGFDDPAEATGSEEEALAVFRRVRDEIRGFVEELARDLPRILAAAEPPGFAL